MIKLEDLQNVLVLVPHPDDEVLGCGGLLLKLKQYGANIKVLLFTKGEKLEAGITPEIRIQEFRESLSSMNIDQYEILNFPDGELNEYKEDIKSIILENVISLNPDVVVLPFLFDPHKDHSILGEIGFQIYREKPYITFLMYFVHAFYKANYLVDITDVVEHLKEILGIYKHSLYNKVSIHIDVFIEGIRRKYALPSERYIEPYILLNEFNSKNELIRYILSGKTCTDSISEALEKIDHYFQFIEFVENLRMENKMLSIKIRELNLEVEIRDKYIKKLSYELKNLTEELDHIKNSSFYKLMIKYRNIIDKYLPEGSFRRHLYSKMIKYIKSWIL